MAATGFVASIVTPVAAAPVTVSGGRTILSLDSHLLGDLGISVRRGGADLHPEQLGRLVLTILGPEAGTLEIDARRGAVHAFGAGSLRHRAQIELVWARGRLSLDGFELRSSLAPLTLELRSPDGVLAFELDHPHPVLDAGGLVLGNLDLRLAEPLAELLGLPRAAGTALGKAEVDTAVIRQSAAPLPSGALCVADFSGTVDVRLESMSTVSEVFHDADRVAMAPAVTLLNVGTADVEWKRAIVPDGGGDPAVVGPHPFLVMNLYRIASGVLEQIGRSGVKHAFFSANSPPCSCQPDQVLYVNCTDLYGVSTNASRRFLAPRQEVTAFTCSWPRFGSHFDALPADDIRDHDEGDHSDPFEHRLTAAAADLTIAGAFYLEAWYLVDGDVDIFNSMGHRTIDPTFDPTLFWSFPFLDPGLTHGSVLDRWVDPAAPGAGAANSVIDTGEGRLQLAVRAVQQSSGLYRYEYALMNFDFDRQIDTFRVPLPAAALVDNVGFGDGAGDPADAWTSTVSAGEIEWQAPPGKALDWGTLFNFRFDANVAPGDVQLELGFLETGATAETTVTSKGPAGAPVPAFELTVGLGGDGGGSAASVSGSIACQPDCYELVGPGGVTELSATALSGSYFHRWEEVGELPEPHRVYPITVDRSRSLTAVFPTCAPDVDLGPQTVSDQQVFAACNTLTAGSGFVVAGPGGEAILRAGQSVHLGDGLTIEQGAVVAIEIAAEQAVP